MRRSTFCIYENKGANQLCGNHAANQHLCFQYIVVPLLSKSDLFQVPTHLLWLYRQPGLCQTWSETLKTGFFMIKFMYAAIYFDFNKIFQDVSVVRFIHLIEDLVSEIRFC